MRLALLDTHGPSSNPSPLHLSNVALFGACIASTDAAAVSAILSSGGHMTDRYNQFIIIIC